MKTILSFFFIIISNVVFSQTLITYTPSTAAITNPGRGLYSHRETSANSSGNMISPLTLSDVNIQRSSKNITLVLRLYYLDQFKASAISTSFLSSIQADFNTLRTSGAKVVVRFAYNQTNQTDLHNDDASKFWVLTHIAQLKNILQQNSDVILCLQAGFIGTYGEWYYTHPDFTNTNLTPNYTNRKEVLDSLISALPKDKMIQIRAPYYKYNSSMYGNGTTGTSAALQLPNAFSGTATARVAHHNDCFLASSADYGTYLNIIDDKNYLAQDTKYLINGGEVCNDDTTYTNCTNAQNELKRFHFTFLNNDYNTTVLNRWNTEGCLQDIKNKLGYRIELIDGTFTDVVKQGYTFGIRLRLKNVGYAPPYDKKVIQFLLKNNSTNIFYPVSVAAIENRYWLPDSTYTYNIATGIGSLPDGNYNLHFAIRDSASSLINNNNYAIQPANNFVDWDATNASYILKRNINVYNSNVAQTPAYTGILWFGSQIPLPTKLISFTALKQDNTVLINWQTTNQINVSHFNIQRSTNGKDFEKNGTQLSEGNIHYKWLDKDLPSATTLYYRLEIVDKDGSKTYSVIQQISNSNKSLTTIYPNPAKDYIVIEGNNINQITITDITGKAVLSKQINFSQPQNINISALNKGFYFIEITTANDIKEIFKIIIQ